MYGGFMTICNETYQKQEPLINILIMSKQLQQSKTSTYQDNIPLIDNFHECCRS